MLSLLNSQFPNRFLDIIFPSLGFEICPGIGLIIICLFKLNRKYLDNLNTFNMLILHKRCKRQIKQTNKNLCHLLTETALLTEIVLKFFFILFHLFIYTS